MWFRNFARKRRVERHETPYIQTTGVHCMPRKPKRRFSLKKACRYSTLLPVALEKESVSEQATAICRSRGSDARPKDESGALRIVRTIALEKQIYQSVRFGASLQ